MKRSPTEHGLSRDERLRTQRSITRIFREGRKTSCRGMHLRYLQNDEGMNRVLFAPVRKYGNAVERNRARRIARESYRLLKHQLRRGFDLAFVLYNDADDLPNRSHQMTTVLQRAGLLIEERKE